MSKRRKFSAEFKRGAVEQASQPGVSCAQVARDLGIRDTLLTHWKREAQSQGAVAFGGAGTPREEEMTRLKRELARIKKERDFLREDSRGTLGAGRVHEDLAEEGETASLNRVARSMATDGLQGWSRPKRRGQPGRPALTPPGMTRSFQPFHNRP